MKFFNVIKELSPSWVLPIVCSFSIPSSLFFSNKATLANASYFILSYYTIGIICILLSFLLMKISPQKREKIVLGSFLLGIYFLITDILAPVQLQLLTGKVYEKIEEPLKYNLIEGLLFLSVVFLAFSKKFKKHGRDIGVFVSFSLLCTQTVMTLSHAFKGNIIINPQGRKAPTLDPLEPAKLTNSPNIYHIILDAYTSSVFLKTLKESGLEKSYKDFVFFGNTTPNYVETWLSVTSIMAGETFKGGNLQDWIYEVKNEEKGIPYHLVQRGYESTAYSSNIKWFHHSIRQSNVQDFTGRFIRFFRLSDLVLLRLAPKFLQEEIYNQGQGILGSGLYYFLRRGKTDATGYYNKLLFKRMMEDEKNRKGHGQYVFGHFMIPHGPHTLNKECEYDEEASDMYTQSVCATRLVEQLISVLKKQGKYDDSLIIVQSDHGNNPDPVYNVLNPSFNEAHEKRAIKPVYDPNQVFNMKDALLVIKPPRRSTSTLTISDQKVMLIDVAPTIYEVAGISKKTEGHSVFSPNIGNHRIRNIHVGGYQKQSNGSTICLCSNYSEKAQLVNYQIDSDNHWSLAEDFSFKNEERPIAPPTRLFNNEEQKKYYLSFMQDVFNKLSLWTDA